MFHEVAGPRYFRLCRTGVRGLRWNVFPSAVNWNRGNSEVGALGNGSSQISSAISAWNAGGAHYALTSSTPNANGILDASDGLNNIVFEKNLTSAGVQPYSCTQGGVLGMGGVHAAVGTHSFNGETFATAREADVSMNQGLGACTLAQFPSEAFNSTVTHELGHTLGFRHSDQTRQQNAVCSSDPTLDCSNSAIMNHIIVFGLDGHLQAWDSRAVSHVYGAAACSAPLIVAQPAGTTIGAGATAQLSVIAAGTSPLLYQWFAGNSGNTSTPVSGGNTATISVNPAVTTSYWVRVTGQCDPVADSAAAIVTVIACPLVTLGLPEAVPLGSAFALSVSTAGGSGFTWTWFQGSASGAGSPIGTGNPLLVSPSKTTTYWCRVTNNCHNSSDSGVVTATIASCLLPQIVSEPQPQTAIAGSTVLLTIGFTGAPGEVTWFQGIRGDTTMPVGSGQTLSSPEMTTTTQFWARVTNACGSADSDAVTITVLARRRAARHF